MKRARKAPTLRTKLAAALLARGEIPYLHGKAMHEDHIISLYDWHHNIRHAEAGGDHFSNLEPMLRPEHKERTRKIDVPQIAKNKRIARKHQRHQERLSALWMVPAKKITLKQAKRKWPSRPFPKKAKR